MIRVPSVTQPRRGADEFLLALQSNLQHHSRRKRVNANNVAPKEDNSSQPNRATRVSKPQPPSKPSSQSKPVPQSKTKQDKKSQARQKKSIKPISKTQEERTKPQLITQLEPPNTLPIQQAVPHNEQNIPQQQESTSHQTGNGQDMLHQVSYPQGNLTNPGPNRHPAVSQSNNNFYLKNKSNIFSDMTYNPATVVQKALKIAEQQPLPAYQSLHTPKRNPHHQQNHGTIPQQPPTYAHDPTSVQSLLYPQSQVQPAQIPVEVINQPQQPFQPYTSYNPTIPSPSNSKPISSHYNQSFTVGAGTNNSNVKNAKELERKKWIQELEAQVREKKEREQNRKAQDNNTTPSFPQHPQIHQAGPRTYANEPTSVQSLLYPQQPSQVRQSQAPDPRQSFPTQQTIPQIQQPQHVVAQQQFTAQQQQFVTQPQQFIPQCQPQQFTPIQTQPQQYTPQPQQQPTYQPQLSHGGTQPTSPVGGFLLGQNSVHVDPVELQRRQEARQRARDNQEFIRQQVEERERKKREAVEKRKLEEEMEMKRIEEEKRKMEEEVRAEAERAKVKERVQLAQIDEMRRKIEEANQKAADIKKSKRHFREHVATNPTPTPARNEDHVHPMPKVPQRTSPIHTNNVGTQQNVTRTQNTTTQQFEVSHEPSPIHMIPETVPRLVPQQMSTYGWPPQQQVIYRTHAGTQTVNESSREEVTALSRENSHLPSETKLIKLKDRELSSVQMTKTSKTSNKPLTQTKKPKSDYKKSKPVFQAQKQAPKPKALYDKNGRRIKPEPIPEEKEVTVKENMEHGRVVRDRAGRNKVSPDQILAEESVKVEEYQSIADIFDDPTPTPRNELPSEEYTLSEDQIQMRYTSPKNERRTIPSSISVRQSNILNQLEKLRMGLKDRRRHVSRENEIAAT